LFYVGGDGNVGIGTTSPTNEEGALTLQIAHGSGSELILENLDTTIADNALVGSVGFKSLDSGGPPPSYSGIKARANGNAGAMDLEFYSGKDNFEAKTPQMVILNGGNVGIGETLPEQILTVNAAASTEILIRESGTETEFVRISVEATANDMVIGWDDADDMHFGVYSTTTDATVSTQMIIDGSTGNVGINDTTPSNALDVGGTVRADDYLEFSRSIPEEGLKFVLGMKNKEDGTLNHSSFPSYELKEMVWDEERDLNGTLIKEAGSEIRESVSLSSQIKYLIKAIQELSAENDLLKEDLCGLEVVRWC